MRGDQEKQEKPRMERMERDDGVSGKMLCRKSGRPIPLICMICMICLLEIRHSISVWAYKKSLGIFETAKPSKMVATNEYLYPDIRSIMQ